VKLGSILVGTRSVKPRACILVSNDIQASLLQEFSDHDMVAVQITYKKIEIERMVSLVRMLLIGVLI
jgi:hypothetical protein